MRLLKNVASVIAVLAAGIFLLSVLVNTEAWGRPELGSNCAGCHGGKVPGAQPAPSKPAPTKPAPSKPAPTTKPSVTPAKPTTPATKPAAPAPAPVTVRMETSVVKINDVNRAVDIRVENGTSYIKARDLEKFFKVSVDWNSANQTAKVSVGGDDFTINVKDGTIALAGETKKLSKPLKIADGRLWLPLRDCAVSAGGTVNFDPLWGISIQIPGLSVNKLS